MARGPISRRRFLAHATSGAALAVPAAWALARPAWAGSARPHADGVAAFDAETLVEWYDVLLDLVRATPGYSPPVTSRAIAYAGLAAYEALLPGMPDHRSLRERLTGFPRVDRPRTVPHHWPSVVAGAMGTTLRALFADAPPAALAEVDALAARTLRAAPRAIRVRSALRGTLVGRAVLAWARSDGGHEGQRRNFPPDYLPPVGAGLWEPTPPAFSAALQPTWGGNRTFAIADGTACDPGPPTPYSTDPSSTWFAEALEVYDTVNGLTPAQLATARYWADDPGTTATPPGHSTSILGGVLRERDATLEAAAEAYVRLGMAVADAFIACWSTKYRHNLVRPITFIRHEIDAAWGDPLPVHTPPFPEYTSGHSVQSGAAAVVLTSTFGTVPFTDRTHEPLGLPARTFASFDAAAEEAAISRLYGGIHFRPAIELGLDQGRCIGEAVTAIDLRA